jgi:hypothetical protein
MISYSLHQNQQEARTRPVAHRDFFSRLDYAASDDTVLGQSGIVNEIKEEVVQTPG